jgi:prenylated cyclic peptide (anacyclamide/piricyclamide family)
LTKKINNNLQIFLTTNPLTATETVCNNPQQDSWKKPPTQSEKIQPRGGEHMRLPELVTTRNYLGENPMKKTVMPKQAAPVERLSPATAGAGAEGGVGPNQHGAPARSTIPFAGDDAE